MGPPYVPPAYPFVQNAEGIRVLVGGVDAVIVNPNTGAALTSSSAVAVVLATLTGGLVTIQFNLPPGQGSSNSLQVR